MAGDCLCVNKGLPLSLLLLWDRASVYVQKLQDTMFSLPLFNFKQHRMLTDFEGVARKNEVGFRIWTSKEVFKYMLWATNEVHAKSKYFMRKLKKVRKSNGQVLAINESMFFWGGEVVPSQLSSWRNPICCQRRLRQRHPLEYYENLSAYPHLLHPISLHILLKNLNALCSIAFGSDMKQKQGRKSHMKWVFYVGVIVVVKNGIKAWQIYA
ncbi:unnamed protein product [Prunus brigantina]